MDYENIDQFGYEIIVGFKLSVARRNWQIDVVPTNLHMQTVEKYDSYVEEWLQWRISTGFEIT